MFFFFVGFYLSLFLYFWHKFKRLNVCDNVQKILQKIYEKKIFIEWKCCTIVCKNLKTKKLIDLGGNTPGKHFRINRMIEIESELRFVTFWEGWALFTPNWICSNLLICICFRVVRRYVVLTLNTYICIWIVWTRTCSNLTK